MVRCNKNKNELLVLTGSVYSFVAYLTAFTLEVLFIIDLAKQNRSALVATTQQASSPLSSSSSTSSANSYDDHTASLEQTRWTLESMQAHVTISCLAISVLYFITFIASLILIVALILRSSFFILIWMCVMTTLYLPEFGLIIYVSVYGWGVDTRNGQTELLFYLFRAILNVIFIVRAHRLFKEWNYEKNFYMMKSGNRFTGYDSPYFIGDSLTTTINPVFSSSTLNLNRYDHIRESNTSPANSSSVYPDYDFHNNNHHHHQNHINELYHNRDFIDRGRRVSAYSRDDRELSFSSGKYRHSYAADFNNGLSRKGFYLPNERQDIRDFQRQPRDGNRSQTHQQNRQNSVLSINEHDDFADCELDLDYRTLTHQRHYNINDIEPSLSGRQSVNMIYRSPTDMDPGQYSGQSGPGMTSGLSPGGLSYSTQSLDRRHLRDMDLDLPEHVILRPLGHQPFDYLHRPGSSSNLDRSNKNFNTQP